MGLVCVLTVKTQTVVVYLGYLLESVTMNVKSLQSYLSVINTDHNDFWVRGHLVKYVSSIRILFWCTEPWILDQVHHSNQGQNNFFQLDIFVFPWTVCGVPIWTWQIRIPVIQAGWRKKVDTSNLLKFCHQPYFRFIDFGVCLTTNSIQIHRWRDRWGKWLWTEYV
jgi:hypothetical protein